MICEQLHVEPLVGLPTIEAGDNLNEHLVAACNRAGGLCAGDIVVVVSKVIARAENRFVNLADIRPDPTAVKLSRVVKKDPRLVHLILQESKGLSRTAPGVMIVRHQLGFISANAGIDSSNVGRSEDWVLLLPENPDASAKAIRQHLEDSFEAPIGVIVSDSHGRPFRKGAQGVAIGLSGVPALVDQRGETDRFGRVMQSTQLPLADQLANVADLVAGAGSEGIAAVRLRGIPWAVDETSCATDLQRPPESDLYA